jgi:hypothetical protein
MSRRTAARVATLALIILLYVGGAAVHAALVNVDVGRHDQGAYLGLALDLARTHFAAVTNRNQMPGYPMVQAIFADPGLDLAACFLRAKAVNIALSVVCLGALHAFCTRTLPKTEARVLTLATAFTVFVFRAAYVQAEVSFYTATFFGFAALCWLWERPSFRAAVVAGALEGVAFLFKGSTPPGLALFVALFLTRETWAAVRGEAAGPRAKTWVLRASQVAALLVAFVAPIAPYLATSKRLYGTWFFNASTHYAAWCDSWDEFMATQDRLGPWWTWGRYPPGDLPSMGHFFATHGLLAIVKRETLGLGEVLGNVIIGHGYLEPILLYLAFVAVGAGFTRAPTATLRAIDPRSAPAFALPYALLYTGLFGFYAPIAAGPRFILMLFLPVLWTLLRAGAAREPAVTAFGRTVTWRDFNALVLLLLGLHVAFVLPATIGRLYAGG